MITSNGFCEEYRQLEKQLASALRLCAEYENALVFPIDSPKLTPERLEELHADAEKIKSRLESRVFVHRSMCTVCLHSA
jgi:molybdopterin-guanine dinucleotide biosynthesis protein A